MKLKIKSNPVNKYIYFFIFITLIFFGIFIRIEFATDSYASLAFSLRELLDQFFSSGRFMVAGLGGILKILKVKPETTYFLSFLLAIISMIVSLYKLYTIINDDIKSEKLKIIIPLLIILNAFSIELFLFIEKGIMVLSIALCIFAVEKIRKFFETKNKKYIIYTLILMLLANFSYQGVVGIFVVISMLYIIKYSKNVKEFLLNNILVALSYGIPAIIDFLLIKVLNTTSRVNGERNILKSLNKIYNGTKNMMATYNILPKYFFLALVIIITIIILYEILKNDVDKKHKTIDILKVVYIIIGTVFVSVAPQIMQNTASVWMVARSTYSFAALFGILALYLFMNYETKKSIEYLTIALSVTLLIVQCYRFNIIETDRYKLNELDYETARIISKKINEYEKNTGNKINKIAIYEDKETEYTYNGIFATGDINIKAFAVDWAIQYILKYYYDINLQITEKDYGIEQEFKEYNWTNFSEMQIKIIENTLHLCKY